VLHPYRLVKDLRTAYETGNTDAVLDGELDGLMEAYLHSTMGPAPLPESRSASGSLVVPC